MANFADTPHPDKPALEPLEEEELLLDELELLELLELELLDELLEELELLELPDLSEFVDPLQADNTTKHIARQKEKTDLTTDENI